MQILSDLFQDFTQKSEPKFPLNQKSKAAYSSENPYPKPETQELRLLEGFVSQEWDVC